MHCLICHDHLSNKMSWTSLLLSSKKPICDTCTESLSKITGPTCPSCSRPQVTTTLCLDCMKWNDHPVWKQQLDKNISIYSYTDFMKEVLAAFKFRGDAELVTIFHKEFMDMYQRRYEKEKLDYAVPIPLSMERLYDRGFNQSQLLANCLPLPQVDILKRIHLEKQSKKTRQQRIAAENMFSIKDPALIRDKKVLLVDDLYTTGTTLRHAAKVLNENGAKLVFSLTLIRS
ncbi:hypothetical protein A9C19_01720 [Bacillus weihaiensis]|uniref:Phosphoribosyltransferase domain-containing protein n=2 Tax=Bacillus weihaiensis TaxID=1547283 RepID=A0A1L3MX45_9BACI|nr:hypothetical protein A9C19_01720 [Bacillus weihaiensis]